MWEVVSNSINRLPLAALSRIDTTQLLSRKTYPTPVFEFCTAQISNDLVQAQLKVGNYPTFPSSPAKANEQRRRQLPTTDRDPARIAIKRTQDLLPLSASPVSQQSTHTQPTRSNLSMWESYYDTTSDIDQTETELFNWEHQTSPDTAPHSRRPLSIGPAPAYKYLSASPPSTFGDKRSSPVYSNKAEFERHQEKVSQQQHHVLNVEMNHAQPIYTAIPTAIPIETSTYHGPDHQPHFHAATHPGYHSQYVQHPVNDQHAAHGLSTSAPEAGEPWNMHHQQHQQQQSRAPNWTYPGMPGALGGSLRCRDCRPYADANCNSIDLFSGRPASSGDQAVMAQGVGLIRYTSEETVAELTKEEKVGPDRLRSS